MHRHQTGVTHSIDIKVRDLLMRIAGSLFDFCMPLTRLPNKDNGHMVTRHPFVPGASARAPPSATADSKGSTFLVIKARRCCPTCLIWTILATCGNGYRMRLNWPNVAWQLLAIQLLIERSNCSEPIAMAVRKAVSSRTGPGSRLGKRSGCLTVLAAVSLILFYIHFRPCWTLAVPRK